MPHSLVYELNTRCWLNELSRQQRSAVTLANIPETHFEFWLECGFTHIWLMGVWTTGPRSREVSRAAENLQTLLGSTLPDLVSADLAGSPYAIAEYRVPESLGGEAGLRDFRQKLHRRGLKLLLDFVPNHVGLDHRWLTEQPDFFFQGVEGQGTFAQETVVGRRWIAYGKDPYFPPWIDVAQLDYRNPATRAAMQAELLKIAGRCDGVRCDMAMLVLDDVFVRTWPSDSRGSASWDFWTEAIAVTRREQPDFLFLAEAYWGLESRLQSMGFDYTYDKELYDDLVHRNSAGVQKRLLSASRGFIEASTHFLENHDEPRIASLLNLEEHRAAALLILSLPGMCLLHEGQLTGASIRIPVQFVRRCLEEEQPAIRQMYQQLLSTIRNSAVRRGTWQLLRPSEAWAGNPTAQNFILIQWQLKPTTFDLVVINLAPHQSQCRVRLDFDPSIESWQVNDLLGAEHFERPTQDLESEGLFLDLPAHAVQLLRFAAV